MSIVGVSQSLADEDDGCNVSMASVTSRLRMSKLKCGQGEKIELSAC